MCPVLPVHVSLVYELQVGLVNQSRGLHRVAGPLAPHVVMGQAVQLVIDQGHQLVERCLIAIAPINEQLRDFVWRGGCHVRFPLDAEKSGKSYHCPSRTHELLTKFLEH